MCEAHVCADAGPMSRSGRPDRPRRRPPRPRDERSVVHGVAQIVARGRGRSRCRAPGRPGSPGPRALGLEDAVVAAEDSARARREAVAGRLLRHGRHGASTLPASERPSHFRAGASAASHRTTVDRVHAGPHAVDAHPPDPLHRCDRGQRHAGVLAVPHAAAASRPARPAACRGTTCGSSPTSTGTPRRAQLGQPPQQLPVVLGGLGEARARGRPRSGPRRRPRRAPPRPARRARRGRRPTTSSYDACCCITSAWPASASRRVGAPVGHHVEDPRVGQPAGDVVDQHRAGRQGRLGHLVRASCRRRPARPRRRAP